MYAVDSGIFPTTPNTHELGKNDYKWSNIYATNIYTDRSYAVQGFYQTSDIHKKDIIGDLDLNKAYELIDKCQTILYTLKNDPSNKQEIGLIAQEVREIFPELISEDEHGVLSLDYAKLTVVILRVMKDVISRLKKLETANAINIKLC